MIKKIPPVVSPLGESLTINERSETLFGERVHAQYVRTDRLFVGLLLFQWIIGIVIACWVSPLTWIGATSKVHPHVWVALFLGGVNITYPLLLAFTCPGSALTRHAIAIAQMLFSTLLIHLMGGRIEAHFHIFGSLAFLAFYRDWRILLTASVVTAADHFLRGLLLPQSIFGVLAPGAWRWAEHTGWVVFEDVFLFISIAQSKHEMQHIAQRQAQLEATNASVEATVLARTTELNASEQRLREAQRVAGLGSWEYNLLTGNIIWSAEMFHLFDLDAAQGAPDYATVLTLYHPDDAALIDACVQQAIHEGKDYEIDLRQATKDGQPTRWYHAVGKILRDGTGQVVQLVGTMTDISTQRRLNEALEANMVLVQDQNAQLEWQQQELAAANAHLEALATTDGLTGAKNHRAFQEKLAEEFNRVERSHRPFSVILLDVDKFKQYNDSFGHPEGDRVLKQVVRVLQETARKTDFVARYGGEEFIILLLETGEKGAFEAAERFRAALEAQEWPLRPVTASFGVSTVSATIETGPQLIDKADKALYASKSAGRNRVTHSNYLLADLSKNEVH